MGSVLRVPVAVLLPDIRGFSAKYLLSGTLPLRVP